MSYVQRRGVGGLALGALLAGALSCGGGGAMDAGDALADLVRPTDTPAAEASVDAGDSAAGMDVAVDTVERDVLADGTMLADADAMSCAARGGYPAGPYGNAMGQPLANLPWEGYYNADGAAMSTSDPYAATSLQALRLLGCNYALVHVSAAY